MFLAPAAFRDFLTQNNYINEIYDALAQDDTSEVVMTALHILRKTKHLRFVPKAKTKESSTLKRNAGNDAYRTGLYQLALALYNEALLFAPKNSKEMKLAYGNRSALFHKLGAWTACCNDVNRCFAMGCPSDIEEKLTKRKNDALPFLAGENFSRTLMSRAGAKCISVDTMTKNTQIPCATSDIKFITSELMPKVVASKNIQVGDVLASERAYVSYTEIDNSSFSCHFCQRKELNLIPCDDCCYALFCDEECKSKCMKEYHEYECKILNITKEFCMGHMPNLMVKAYLKLRSSCKSWDEFITASYNMGSSRIKTSSIQEIYDTNNKYSVLCFKDDRPFVHGVIYNACFVAAAILNYLEVQVPSFFPKDTNKKQRAMQASARVMMFLSVYANPLPIMQGQIYIKSDTSNYGSLNFGLYPFIAKLKNSCNPNTIIANCNNKLILIALRPIRCEEELTVPYLWHKHDTIMDNKLLNIKTFMSFGRVCGCPMHSKDSTEEAEALSNSQKKYFSTLNLFEMESRLKNIEINNVYHKLVKALTVLSDVTNSKEYIKIYTLWRRCVFFFEVVCSDNNVLDISCM